GNQPETLPREAVWSIRATGSGDSKRKSRVRALGEGAWKPSCQDATAGCVPLPCRKNAPPRPDYIFSRGIELRESVVSPGFLNLQLSDAAWDDDSSAGSSYA